PGVPATAACAALLGVELTLPDYFSSRFEDNSGLLRIISAIVIL
ncbi:sodium/proline symporter, partial [Pseudomonas amygdali pv. mori str. 301020]